MNSKLVNTCTNVRRIYGVKIFISIENLHEPITLQTLIVVMIVVVLILAIAGFGWNTFYSGVKKGAEKLGVMPAINNITGQGKKYVTDMATNTTKEVMGSLKSSMKSELSNSK